MIQTLYTDRGRDRNAAAGLGGLEVAVDEVRFQPLAGMAGLGAEGTRDASIPLQVLKAIGWQELSTPC